MTRMHVDPQAYAVIEHDHEIEIARLKKVRIHNHRRYPSSTPTDISLPHTQALEDAQARENALLATQARVLVLC